ncbi:hypothetical protein QBC37DRAFT_407634 [Rhypophila decipiens]|uniref:Uncharacterized protein n=1 Tax=Rhypophila decipiens TaxID=261697 RepID=A0AAN6XSE0_9PEZI|nr:hypothetical protein QBC37DRAFT_407634 [Rhypophila decipiens]
MTIQHQSRFSGGDQESTNKLLQDYLDSVIKEEGNNQPFVAPGTQEERDRNSVKERIVLGPEERAMVRTLNSAYSVIEVWRKLIRAADFKVLRGERKPLPGRTKYQGADGFS